MELNEREDGAEVQAALAELTGQRTVPNVFIKGQHLGGNDDTQRANRDGTLLKMLA
jgi:glutaredoxin 3|tara:strand:- start:128 stop:295 length:168 start_codon:yes stop_codon:yes gene_type:complete